MTFPSVTKRTVALFAASVLLLSDMGGLPSAIANGEVPSLQDAQETVEEETGWDIDWENPIGRSARAGIIRERVKSARGSRSRSNASSPIRRSGSGAGFRLSSERTAHFEAPSQPQASPEAGISVDHEKGVSNLHSKAFTMTEANLLSTLSEIAAIQGGTYS